MPDLTDSVCRDSNNRFDGVPCEALSPFDKNCRLLKEAKMKEFWKNCRVGNFEILHHLIDKNLMLNKHKWGSLNIDEGEDIDYGKIIDRLTGVKLIKGHNLAVWIGYLKKAVYLEVRRLFVRRRLIPEKKQCGACIRLSESKVCIQTNKPQKKTDPSCDAYQPKIAEMVSIDDSESICGVEGFSSDFGGRTAADVIEIKDQIFVFQNKLNQRIENSKHGSAERRRFERQYDIFTALLHLFREKDCDLSDAVSHLAQKNRLNKKTVYRDVQEIEEFLKKMS